MSKPLDRLTLLETFVRIADRGAISAAARDLGLSQASASRQLKELETRMRAQLMQRTTHSLSLTAAGQALLVDARGLLAGWDALEERHVETEGTLRGRVKVVAPLALGQGQLLDVALGFQREHPAVTLDWTLTDDGIRFAEVGCDCWVKIGAVPDERLVVRPLGRVERLVVLAPELASSCDVTDPEALFALPFIALSAFEGGAIRLTHADGQQVTVAPPLALVTNNIVAQKQAARLGAGAAILPRWFVADELAAGTLDHALPDWRAATLDINLAYLPGSHRPKRLTLFLEALAAGVAALPGVEPYRRPPSQAL
ncbi:MAG: LysR family transcriptional regulator [Pseudomonadota bacterium]